ncbi:MAG: hypothetical protein MZV70_46700 [Desulfobacterales bacterium]|nr:hypothetical protein [Desulfobacterales bacterium]
MVKAGAVVDVVMTAAATEFVRPLTFQALTHRPVALEMFSLLQETEIGHVSLGQRAALMIIAPATANTIAKLAHGLADNMLATTALACRAPILLAPAMESGMWDNPATTGQHGDPAPPRLCTWWGPSPGRLASGGYGSRAHVRARRPSWTRRAGCSAAAGRWPAARWWSPPAGRARPSTRCASSATAAAGRMGFALAAAARDRGADGDLDPRPRVAAGAPHGVEDVPVESADADAAPPCSHPRPARMRCVMAAAVADYRPTDAGRPRRSRSRREDLRLEPGPHGRTSCRRWPSSRGRSGRPRAVVGFAAETQDVLENARDKLARKGLDLIVANDVSAADSGFEVDTNRVTLLDAVRRGRSRCR